MNWANKAILVAVSLTLTLFAGCGGSSSSDGGTDTTPPTVSSTSPADSATNVALNTTVSAIFSEAMTNSTLNTSTFTLAISGGAAVTGAVGVSGNTATFTPSADLLASTQYTATVSTGAKDAAGNALAANKTWNFTTSCSTLTPSPTTVSGTASVGAGRTVTLIEIDASGSQVGATIATTTTDACGGFTLNVPPGFTPASRYVVRAAGPSGNLDAIVTAQSGLRVDPVSHVTKEEVVVAASNLSTFTTSEVEVLREQISEIAQEVDPTGLSQAALLAQITQAADNNDTFVNMRANASNDGTVGICGKVSYQGNPLPGINITVRDFNNEFVVHAKAITNASGDYCADVLAGDYFVGAINLTNTSFAASEWWSAGGTAYSLRDGGKVTVGAVTTTADFVLETGGRIEGAVTGAGQPLEGVRVTLFDFRTGSRVGSVKTDASGKYNINVIPGGNGYRMSVYNRTWRPYASLHYNGAAGGINSVNEATKLNVTASATQTLNHALARGRLLTARVLNGPGGSPEIGLRVRIQVSYASNPYSKTGSSERLRTDRDGTVRVWLKPDMYNVQTYGQAQPADLTSVNQALSFAQQVGRVTATIRDSGGTNPVRNAILFLDDLTGAFVNQELSLGDGTVTLYAPASANYLLEVRIDDAQSYAYGSIIYNNKQVVLGGDSIPILVSSTNSLGDIVLPAAGVLKGTVTYTGGAPAGGVRVQARFGGTTGADAFVETFARGDGTFELGLPASTYNLVRAGGTTGINASNVVVTAGADTIRDFTLP